LAEWTTSCRASLDPGWSAPEAVAPEDPDVEIFTRERSHADIPSALQSRQSCRLPFFVHGDPSEPFRVQFGRVRIAPQGGTNECPRLAVGDQAEEPLILF
jgi:hypothetical protein